MEGLPPGPRDQCMRFTAVLFATERAWKPWCMSSEMINYTAKQIPGRWEKKKRELDIKYMNLDKWGRESSRTICVELSRN